MRLVEAMSHLKNEALVEAVCNFHYNHFSNSRNLVICQAISGLRLIQDHRKRMVGFQ